MSDNCSCRRCTDQRDIGWRDGWTMGRRALMLQLLRDETIDRSHGFSLPGDSALAVTLGGFVQHLVGQRETR